MRTTIITGAGSGMGRALASLLRARGERVVGIDLVNIDPAGDDIACDLSDPAARAALVARLLDGEERIDAVVTCAGVSAPAPGSRVIAVNYFATVRLLEGLLPRLQQSSAPRALAVSSIASLLPFDAALVGLCHAGEEAAACAMGELDASLAYRSSKRALTAWVRRTASSPEWAGRGVLLNGVSPGTVRTPLANHTLATPEGRAAIARNVPIALADYAEPEDLAPIMAFMVSAQNRYMVGQVPFVDGGSDVLMRGDGPL